MSSATLSLHDSYPHTTAAVATASAASLAPVAALSNPYLALSGAGTAGKSWMRRPGLAITLLVHGAILLAAVNFSASVITPPAPPPALKLIILQPPPKPITLTRPEPTPVKQKQVTLTPPKPVAPPVPLPKVVTPPVETAAPPATPVQAEQIAPAAPPAPAPAPPVSPAPASTAPQQISTEGIPTDYVKQVYARINSSTDYPREAKMRRQQGKVGYRLTLSPQGALLSFDIESSGVEALDEAARAAIRRAAPFPKLPELGASSYLLAGNIVFKIQ